MDSRKFFIFAGAVVSTILGIALIVATTAPQDAYSFEVFIFATLAAIAFADAAFTIFGVVVAIKDRSFAWAAAIFISGIAFPTNIVLIFLYLYSIRDRDERTELPSAGWYQDPIQGHDLRYWNGSTWSDIVSDSGCLSRETTVRPCLDA